MERKKNRKNKPKKEVGSKINTSGRQTMEEKTKEKTHADDITKITGMWKNSNCRGPKIRGKGKKVKKKWKKNSPKKRAEENKYSRATDDRKTKRRKKRHGRQYEQRRRRERKKERDEKSEEKGESAKQGSEAKERRGN